MKIEFIQEKKPGYNSTYYTQVNDSYVPNSLSYDKQEAYEVYKQVKKNNGNTKKINFKTVLEVHNIENVKK